MKNRGYSVLSKVIGELEMINNALERELLKMRTHHITRDRILCADVDSLYEGTDEEVDAELRSLGVDIESAESRLSDRLSDTLSNYRNAKGS